MFLFLYFTVFVYKFLGKFLVLVDQFLDFLLVLHTFLLILLGEMKILIVTLLIQTIKLIDEGFLPDYLISQLIEFDQLVLGATINLFDFFPEL